MSKWFGKGCEHQACQWEENEVTGGPDFKEAEPTLIFCTHKGNADECEGNCKSSLCPLGSISNDRMAQLKSELASITGSQEMALEIFNAMQRGKLTGVTVGK